MGDGQKTGKAPHWLLVEATSNLLLGDREPTEAGRLAGCGVLIGIGDGSGHDHEQAFRRVSDHYHHPSLWPDMRVILVPLVTLWLHVTIASPSALQPFIFIRIDRLTLPAPHLACSA